MHTLKKSGSTIYGIAFCILIALAAGLYADGNPPATSQSPDHLRWFKGNTHTHTLWSDGDGAPEMVADWYRSHGYHFLVLSDHNVMSAGLRYWPIEEKGRLKPQHVEEIKQRFGEKWVELNQADKHTLMRLKTLHELREYFETPGEFIFISGEEITDSFENHPVHINGINLSELIKPQGGTSVRDTLQRNIDAVIEQGRKLNQPVLAHVNHPNCGWAITAEDIASIRGERFFEVYNGHPQVHNNGDAEHLSTDQMWDIALTLRLTQFDLGLLFGLATDDAHHYHEIKPTLANTGRGWIVVRAEELTPEAIIKAMRRGDFYASSGVEIKVINTVATHYEVHISPEPDVTYTTQFIGTRRKAEGFEEPGQIFFETTENPARYDFVGDELYVRAKVFSSRTHPNPHAAGDLECAWLQPVIPSVSQLN